MLIRVKKSPSPAGMLSLAAGLMLLAGCSATSSGIKFGSLQSTETRLGNTQTNVTTVRQTQVASATAIAPTPVPSMQPSANTEAGTYVAHLGSALTTARGMTLYTYDYDLPNATACVGDCLRQYAPYVVQQGSRFSQDFDAYLRPDGSLQWTFRNQPLYTFRGDLNPYDRKGEGGAWRSIAYPILDLAVVEPAAVVPTRLASPPGLYMGTVPSGYGAVSYGQTQYVASPPSAVTPVPPMPTNASYVPLAQPFYGGLNK